MKHYIKLVIACLFLAFGVSTIDAMAGGKKVSIPVIGKTVDGKYPIYNLEGDVDDLTYFSGNTVWQPSDLPGRMVYLAPADAKSKTYNCGFTCKDKANHTVGLNPAYK